MPNPLYIPQKDHLVQIPFDRVKEYAVLTGLRSEEGLDQLIMKGLSLTLDLEYNDGRTQSYPINIWQPEDIQKGQLEKINIPIRFSGVKRAFLSAKFNTAKGNELESPLFIEYEIIDKLPMKIPDAGFSEHLSDGRNLKILFSAKFGQGKSTFLDYYFKEREDQYNVFRLFPVNYSVASNQDIFRYIKCELIFQLLSDNSEFDEENIGKEVSKGEFLKKNLDRVLAPLLLLAPSIGQNMYQMFEKYKELYSEYAKYHDNIQTDDKKLAEEYLQHFTKTEGNLYEDDFYTQLIRQQLAKLRVEDSKKENILIIDDLDRMDPEHIFRILNVFSAHYDQFHIYGNETDNKFGFDRVILVCDYDNIKHIYEYKYGEKVDFPGYINKYFSTKKFEFNSQEVAHQIIFNIDNLPPNEPVQEHPHYAYLKMFLYKLSDQKLLSLRDLLQLRSISVKDIVEKLKSLRKDEVLINEPSCVFTPAIALLGISIGFVRFKTIFSDLNHSFWGNDFHLHQACFQLFRANDTTESLKMSFSWLLPQFTVQYISEYRFDYPYEYEQQKNNLIYKLEPKELNLNYSHFKDEFIKLVDKIESIKHLL